jgi:methylated-DNA-[protein]-cysteine S-methyltransferase
MYYTNFKSPVGPLLLAADDHGLCLISFSAGGRAVKAEPNWKRDESRFKETIRQLQAYFRGELKDFNLPLALEGTPFQRGVWKNLLAIPYGKTISYGQLADRIGQPKAVRAVGLANGQNPIPIIIPCHRVIGSNGKLTGYGGGLPVKEKLLALESRQLRLL